MQIVSVLFLKVNLKVGFDTLFRCNLKKSDLKDCSNSQLPLFWKQTLEIWCEANYRSIDQIENPNEEILWLNSNIKLDHKTIFIKEMFDNNIVRVKDLQKDDKTWLNFDSFRTKYPSVKINFLHYHRIINAIPIEYKNNRKGNDPKKDGISLFISSKKVPRTYYHHAQTNNIASLERSFNKHRQYMNDFLMEDFEQSFEIMYQCTRSTKLLDFQYRLLHFSITTNKEAHHYFRVIDNDRCTFCSINQENIHHLMLHCRHSRDIWDRLQDFLFARTGILIPFDEKDKMFGNLHFPYFKLYNHLMILTKQFIYASRCLNEIPLFQRLEMKILREFQIEKLSSNGQESFQKVLDKWSPIFPTVNDQIMRN